MCKAFGLIPSITNKQAFKTITPAIPSLHTHFTEVFGFTNMLWFQNGSPQYPQFM
jgi:hypothetical protein